MHQPTLGALFSQALRTNQDAVAIIDGGRAFTYRQLGERVGRLLTLFDRRGYRAGYRFGLAMPMGFDFLSCYIATQIGGFGYCDLPPSMPLESLRQRLVGGDLGTVILQPGAFAGDAATLFDGTVIATTPAKGLDSLDELLAACEPSPLHCRPAGRYASIVFTGGSTGLPKAEGFTGEAGAALALAIMASVPFPAQPITVAYRTGGLVMQLGLNQTLVRGGTVVTIPDFDLAAIGAAVRAHRANVLFLATRTVSTLAEQPDFDGMRGQIKIIFHGGEPIAPAKLRQALDAFGQVFVASYGASETGGAAAFLLPEDHDPERRDRLISAGRPLPGVDIEVRDEDGRTLPPGAAGEVAIRSPGQMDCYIGEPEKTASTIRDGWVYTGDVGVVSEDGYLTILDRTAFAVKSGGRTVYPRVIDAHLSEHPAVSIAVTIPIEDPVCDNRICVAVTLRGDMAASEAELLAFLDGAPDVPKVHHIAIFDELPIVAGNLKIDRAKIRAALEGRLLQDAG